MLNQIYAGNNQALTVQGTAQAPCGTGLIPHLSIINAQYGLIIDGIDTGTAYQIDITSSVSAQIIPGRYDWVIYVTGTDTQITLASGRVAVLSNPATATPTDKRSHARKMLDAIEAILEGRATNGDLDIIKLQVPGSRRADFDPTQLIPMRDKYRVEVIAEERAAAVARGERINNTLKVRFQ